jgi:hypothetical protein
MVSAREFLALCGCLVGLVGGARWGGRYGSAGEMFGGIAGLSLGFATGYLYHVIVLDRTGKWAVGLVRQRRRFGVAIYAAYLLAGLAIWLGLVLGLSWLVLGWLTRDLS